MHHNVKKQNGSAAIYIIVLILLIMTSSAIALSNILSRMIRTSQDVIASERAFYAANSGLEEAMFILDREINDGNIHAGVPGNDTISDINGTVEYGASNAEYTVIGAKIIDVGGMALPCIESEGKYDNTERNLITKSLGC